MKFVADKIGDALAWAAIIALLAGAFVIARFAGFLGLAVLGLIAAAISLRVEADEQNPLVWARADFDPARKAEQVYGQDPNSAEQRAAERREFISPLRFGRWCGIALAAIGAVGFVWRQWW